MGHFDTALEFEASQEVKSLYLSFLEQLEDIRKLHDQKISQLKKALQCLEKRINKKSDSDLELEPMICLLSFFDEEFYNRNRKKILDNGNQTIRNICKKIEDKYSIELK